MTKREQQKKNYEREINKTKTFKLYWLDGKTEIVKGYNIKDAVSKAGLGAGSIPALDWYEEIK